MHNYNDCFFSYNVKVLVESIFVLVGLSGIVTAYHFFSYHGQFPFRVGVN